MKTESNEPVISEVSIETLTTLQLQETLSALTSDNAHHKHLAREKQKLDIMIALEHRIQAAISSLAPEEPAAPPPKKSMFKKIAGRLFYYFLLTFGLFEDAIGSYLYGSTLIGAIPGIPHPVLIVCSIIFTALNCLLFFAFEVSMMKQAFGIPLTTSKLHQLIQTHTEQVKHVTNINTLLSTLAVLPLDDTEYDEFITLAESLNNELRLTNQKIGQYHESIAKKILKYGVIAFGVFTSITGSYFMATTFITACALPLLGTPIGWALIVLTMAAGLGFFYAMGGTGMANMVNPDRNHFHHLKKELAQFEKNHENTLQESRQLKHLYSVKKPTQDMSTQTNDVDDDEPTIENYAALYSPTSTGIKFFKSASDQDLNKTVLNKEPSTPANEELLINDPLHQATGINL